MTCLLEAIGVRDTTTNKVQSCSSRSCLVGEKTHTRTCARTHTHTYIYPVVTNSIIEIIKKYTSEDRTSRTLVDRKLYGLGKGKRKFKRAVPTSRWSNI